MEAEGLSGLVQPHRWDPSDRRRCRARGRADRPPRFAIPRCPCAGRGPNRRSRPRLPLAPHGNARAPARSHGRDPGRPSSGRSPVADADRGKSVALQRLQGSSRFSCGVRQCGVEIGDLVLGEFVDPIRGCAVRSRPSHAPGSAAVCAPSPSDFLGLVSTGSALRPSRPDGQ